MSKKIISLLLAVVIMATLVISFPTQAATKSIETKITTTTNLKVVPSVTTGTTKINIKKGGAVYKFTATQTKTYTLTFSNLTNVKDSIQEIRKTNYNRVAQTNLCMSKYASEYKYTGFQVTDKRSIKLKKGETIIIYSYPSSAKSYTYTLNIK